MGFVSRRKSDSGYTIVELLVVIVVIGILAAVIITTYVGISQKALRATLAADMSNAATQIAMFKAENDSYPTAINCTNTQPTEICLKSSGNNSLSYAVDNSSSTKTFRLTAISSGYSYSTSQNGLACPVNFIIVPGNSIYGTSDFCVMKYEAKQSNSTTPISQASGTPWRYISQNNAAIYSANVEGCTGCHLITEAEWMTLAHNIAIVPSNWSSGVVGTGYIYRGHTDSSPSGPIEASTDDSDGYYLTENSSVSGKDQRRTLTLTNGEVIWDLPGNTYEFTAGQVPGGEQPGLIGESAYAIKQWNAITDSGGDVALKANPSYANPAAASWTTTNGIGLIYSNAGEASLHVLGRGGWWGGNTNAGIFYIHFNYSPTTENQYLSFRVAR